MTNFLENQSSKMNGNLWKYINSLFHSLFQALLDLLVTDTPHGQ